MEKLEKLKLQGKLRPHFDLNVWKKSIDLVKSTYKLTEAFPSDEKFGIISQLRRAAVSIPANIAEGASRINKKEFLRFLDIANGSLNEVETLLILSLELNFINENEFLNTLEKINEIGAMLKGLIKSLRAQLLK